MSEFPGYLGWTSQSVLAIHADWPAYPAEHGWEVALTSFALFPPGTEFVAIDDIDRCVLFLASGLTKHEAADPFDARNFHLAAWHEDLLELARRQLVEGITGVTELTARLNQFRGMAGLPPVQSSDEAAADALPDVFAQLSDGTPLPLPAPSATEFDDQQKDWVLPAAPVRVHAAGWVEAERLLAGALLVPDTLARRVEGLLEREQFDTVVREIGAALETCMRLGVGSNGYGRPLIDEFVARLRRERRYIDAHLKNLRLELLTAFKFVRNFYAHRLVDVPRAQGLAMISRMFSLYGLVEQLTHDDRGAAT